MPPKGNYNEPDKGNENHNQSDIEMTRKLSYNNGAFVNDEQDKNHNIKKQLETNEKDTMDFDDLLPHIGEFGTYQKTLFLLMIPFAFFVAWVYFTQIFITINPEQYWCKVPELENLTVHER